MKLISEMIQSGRHVRFLRGTIAFLRSHILLLISLLIALLPILLTNYFLTGDGPSHVYNAAIFADLIKSHNQHYYSQYYHLSPTPEPNLICYIIIGALIQVTSPIDAEKIFLIVYTISFIASLYYLSLTVNGQSKPLVLGFPMLVHHRTFLMGFYNFSFSFVFLFISLALLLRNRSSWRKSHLLALFISNTLLFLSHPITLVLLFAFAFAHFLFFIFHYRKQDKFSSSILTYALQLFLAFSVAFILFFNFIFRKDLSNVDHAINFHALWNDLFTANSLLIFTLFEQKLFEIFLVLGLITLISALISKYKMIPSIRLYLLSLVLICLVAYFRQPESLAGAGITLFRLQFALFCILFVLMISIVKKSWINYLSIIYLLLSIILNIHRSLIYHKISTVNYYVQKSFSSIEANKITLPIIFDICGLDINGNNPSRAWLYLHAYDYVGAMKPTLLPVNYEAGTYNFPVLWNNNPQPFEYFKCDNSNIESFSPCANIPRYESLTGSKIDYVVLLFRDEEQQTYSDDTKKMLVFIESNFDLVAQEGNDIVRVYKRR